MTERPRILLLGDTGKENESLLSRLGDTVETVPVGNPIRAFARLAREKFDAVFVASPHRVAYFAHAGLREFHRCTSEAVDAPHFLH